MPLSINWKELEFKYMQTAAYIRCDCIGGKWGALQVCTDPMFSIHVAATCFHYGQACFEGLKAFTHKDGRIGIFRPEENAKRMIDTAHRLVMHAPSVELFLDAARLLINKNLEYMPPYGTGASMYLRPVLFGTSPHVGVHASEDYTFLMLAMPVGPYYKNGFFPVKALVVDEFDRAAPRGVGNVKAAGNYAAGMRADFDTKAKGYPISLYLDSTHHEYVDEFGTSNFLAITKENTYVTPDSSSVLPSITNKSLQAIAQDMGIRVERRPIHINEVADFREVGACGTAAVITPVNLIKYRDREFTFGLPTAAGETLTKLYTRLQQIQYGEYEDTHGWNVMI